MATELNEVTNLSFALTALLARLRGALIFDGGGRSQEDASALRAGESAVLVVVIIVAPRDVVWDQVPAIIQFVLSGLGKGWAEWGRSRTERRERGTTWTVELGDLVEGWGHIAGEDEGVRGELGEVVLDFEREGGLRDREGHWFRRREKRRRRGMSRDGGGGLIYGGIGDRGGRRGTADSVSAFAKLIQLRIRHRLLRVFKLSL